MPIIRVIQDRNSSRAANVNEIFTNSGLNDLHIAFYAGEDRDTQFYPSKRGFEFGISLPDRWEALELDRENLEKTYQLDGELFRTLFNLAYFLQSLKDASGPRSDTIRRCERVLAAMARDYADVFEALAPALPRDLRDLIPNLASDKAA